MNGFACHCIEVERHNSGDRFPLTRLHFCNVALVHSDPTEDLHIVGDHVPLLVVPGDVYLGATETTADTFDNGIGLWEDLIDGGALLDPLAKFIGFGAK